MNNELTKAMTDLNVDKVLSMAKADLESGEDPLRILEACQKGMAIIGERFQTGDFFLCELLMVS